MKKFTKILTTVMALIVSVSCLGMVGCSKAGGKKGELHIQFYEGGFGRDWLVAALDDFVAEKAANGEKISYKLTADSTASTSASTKLEAGRNLPDIFMTQSNDWSEFVTLGYLEPLDDTYETEVERLDGSKIKVKDLIMDELQEYPYRTRSISSTQSRPWIMPWSLLETSIIYNKTLLEKTKHTQTTADWNEGELWTSEPKTMQELAYLCGDVNHATNQAIYKQNNGNKSVIPLSWAEAGINYFQNIIYVLWAQQQGVETSYVQGEGSYYDFWNFESKDVWKQTGIQTAIDEWREIVVDEDNRTWKNSSPYVGEDTFIESARRFCAQEALMLLNGSFFENECEKYFTGIDAYDRFEFRMMNVPLSAKPKQLNADGTAPAIINFCSSDDLMFVPAKATNKGLAKEFLAYLCNERYLLDFTLKTGCLRPFDYDPVALTADDTDVVWSDFFNSCFNMKKNADFNIFTYPLKDAREGTVSEMYTYFKPELFDNVGVVSAMRNMRYYDGRTIMINGSSTFEAVSVKAGRNWDDRMIKLS